jgi:hypothetical protein
MASLFAQVDSAHFIKIKPGFRFNDGIYINHSQLVTNTPILKNRIITDLDRNDFDFFSKLISLDVVSYFDDYGARREVKISDLWGFCNRGSIYINWNNEFFRVPVVGSICHFVANITVYDDRYNTPFYGYNYYSVPNQSSHSEIRQFIMDFKTGKVLEYDVDNLKLFLRSDTVLFNEFEKLKSRKQNEMKFLYLRKFNEKNPIYLPKP